MNYIKKSFRSVSFDSDTFTILNGTTGSYNLCDIDKVWILNEKASKRGKQEPFLAVIPNGPLPAGIFSEPYLFVGLKIIMKDGTICAIYVSKEKTQVGTDQYKEDRKEAEAIRICLSN